MLAAFRLEVFKFSSFHLNQRFPFKAFYGLYNMLKVSKTSKLQLQTRPTFTAIALSGVIRVITFRADIVLGSLPPPLPLDKLWVEGRVKAMRLTHDAARRYVLAQRAPCPSPPPLVKLQGGQMRESIDYRTSMITDEHPLRGVVVLPGSWLFSHTTRS